MKKIALLLLLIPIIGFSQDCKFEKNEIDPFSKTKVINSRSRVIVDVLGKTVVLQFLYNKQPSIIFDFTLGNFAKNDIVISGNKVLVLLNNEEVISFITEENVNSKLNFYMSMTNFIFNLKYQTSLSDLEKIKAYGIKSIRLETKENQYDFEVTSKKHSEKITSIIDCFIKEVSN